MRHRKKITSIGRRNRDQNKLLLKNLATSLILNEKIKTTKAKGKAVQPLIDKLFSKAKNPNKVIAIREVSKMLTTDMSSKKVFEELLKRYENRNSGYTSMKEIGFRAGDAAPLVQIELMK